MKSDRLKMEPLSFFKLALSGPKMSGNALIKPVNIVYNCAKRKLAMKTWFICSKPFASKIGAGGEPGVEQRPSFEGSKFMFFRRVQ